MHLGVSEDEYKRIVKHLRDDWSFMGKLQRSKSRTNSTGEFFTPVELVQAGLQLYSPESWNPEKTWVETSVGDGQILSEILIKKIENGSTYENALDTIFGVDFMVDNCRLCIQRLYMVSDNEITTLKGTRIPKKWRHDALTAVFKVNGKICNIVCADGLTYNYKFGHQEI